ncbi:MAG: glycosyltransferase family 39 protein [Chloroflexota bacterium]
MSRSTCRLPFKPAVILILVLAAALRFYRLAGQSLWADEGNSVALARRSFAEIAQRTAFDIHPPLYYWLLKIWITVFGDSEIGLRSLSALLGVGVVYLIGVLGTRLFSPHLGLIAALLAALSPFQIYYSQEARMYMLLTFLSCLTVLAALRVLSNHPSSLIPHPSSLLYLLAVTAGLYTHYAYPLILLVVNSVAFIHFWRTRYIHHSQISIHNSQFIIHNSQFLKWFSLQLVPLLLYLPWLPIAWRQMTTWPAEKSAASLISTLETISVSLVVGLAWPYNTKIFVTGALGLALLAGLWLEVKSRPPQVQAALPDPLQAMRFTLLWLWFLLPVCLTVIIFSPAFLKFLLVAAPPLALLLAMVIEQLPLTLNQRPKNNVPVSTFYVLRFNAAAYLIRAALLASLAGASALALYHYYANPAFGRDNYRGIVSFIKAVGDPQDAVILDAEGQQDVFNYYFEQEPPVSLPVYPLPRRRPLDKAATLAELQQMAQTADTIYAVYWATQQADPDGLIEGWLDRHLFKATDRWYGNVRLVSYGNLQAAADFSPRPVDYRWGEHIRLTGYALSPSPIIPGDILQVALTWVTDAPLAENYTVFVQVLDAANHLVGQRDAPPLLPDTSIADKHGVFIEPGTPPGRYRVIAGLYNSDTGQRLAVNTGNDFVELGTVEIVRPAAPLPLEAFDIQVPLHAAMPEITLLGYDLYKLGHRSDPATPLYPGDALHLVLYWRSDRPAPALENRLTIQIVARESGEAGLKLTTTPAGVDYPISAWQPGEIVRAQFDLLLSDLQPGAYRLAVELGGRRTETGSFRVE